MIERFYLKECLSFQEAELKLQNGLVVFSGPSGSGKSVLMRSILATLGLEEPLASLSEATTSWKIDEEKYAIESDEITIFKQIKKEKNRFFVNAQNISKKVLCALSKENLRHLSLKDFSDFEDENLLNILDSFTSKKSALHLKELESYEKSFLRYEALKKELHKLLDEEKRVNELKEFNRFEIEKIESINPKEGEDDELMHIKKLLSRREKIQEKIDEAQNIFNFESSVSSTLNELEVESAFFDDMMNELRGVFESVNETFSELDEMDIESILDRIEQISELKRRFGSISEALVYKEEKIEELKRYENIEIAKESLEKEVLLLEEKLTKLAESLSTRRSKNLKYFSGSLNEYLHKLFLEDATLTLSSTPLHVKGYDKLALVLNNTNLAKISSGEFNRLRLAILAVKSSFLKNQSGVLMLDEIDANLSGEESMSVAKVLREMAKTFQIFVISHQPQLTSMANQHFIVDKECGVSFVKELSRKERINEIARMISTGEVTDEARTYASALFEEEKHDN